MVATYGMLSMTPDSSANTNRTSTTAVSASPPVASAAIPARSPITPVFTSAPIITNSPAKNSSVSHSTLARNSFGLLDEISTRIPAPSNATTDGSTWNTECPMNPANTATSTTPHLTSGTMSWMASRSFSSITLAARSGSKVKEPRNSTSRTRVNTSSSITTIGAMWTRKSLNVSPARLPMMMFGGSPINVAAPPMFDASTLAIRNGTGSMSSWSHTNNVTDATNRTVVTLSRNADAVAVISTSSTITRNGEPLARLAAQIAVYSNTPVRRSTPTMIIIIPSSRKMTVPVDAGLVGVERVLRPDHTKPQHQARTRERHRHLRQPLGRDEHVGHHEHGHRDPHHAGHPRVTAAPAPTAATR
ncbi:hypothetical protein CLV71_114155 [Actinophytocola oryzae]|uniref:Uncharacterized protein n=1 Tax=Actinophytocola oryzae TaxID=502181 RepID=A0A4R7V7S5_9PSEU|nr:hypothetical protein CLV71_114155 [Actinophytocola oryzae]